MRPRNKQTTLRVRESCILMDFLSRHFSGMSRTSMKGLLRNGNICVNGHPETKYNLRLDPGDVVLLNSGNVNYELRSSHLKLLYEDDYLLVIDKNEGLLSVTASATKEGLSAFSILLNYLQKKDPQARLYVVHRLDKATSGVMMFAKTPEMQHYLRDHWKQAISERTYMALTEGCPEKKEDTIVSYLHENRAQIMLSSHHDDGGKLSVTHYRVVRESTHYCLLRVNLETGRKNQIRVHLAEIGHPIVGDNKYGASTNPIGRLCLHAKTLAFRHPATESDLRFETPVPRKFNALLMNDEEEPSRR